MDKINIFLPKNYRIFLLEVMGCCWRGIESQRLVFYINDKKLDRTQLSDSFAYVETLHLKERNELSISWIGTKREYKRNGLATLLLIYSTMYYKTMHDISIVTLDDCSDWFISNPATSFLENNLYVSLGFEYLKPNMPEMEGKPSVIINKYDSVVNKYSNNSFYLQI